jgi:hypothetical protein
LVTDGTVGATVTVL